MNLKKTKEVEKLQFVEFKKFNMKYEIERMEIIYADPFRLKKLPESSDQYLRFGKFAAFQLFPVRPVDLRIPPDHLIRTLSQIKLLKQFLYRCLLCRKEIQQRGIYIP